MTATKTVAQSTFPRNSDGQQHHRNATRIHFHRLFPRSHGVVVLAGYGIRVSIDRGHLILEDGICDDRRAGRFPRVHHGLQRVIVIGADGFISLAALRWMADQNISFLMLERDGSVLLCTSPVAASDTRLRRAQACAQHSPSAVDIVRELIRMKLAGQEELVREKLHNAAAADSIARFNSQLEAASTIDAIRFVESHGAGIYWTAWQAVEVEFPKSDLPRVPNHWKTFGTRRSPISGTSRRAPNPVNAILNYLYTLLESETRLAITALGMDPGFGLLHVDHSTRDSLVYDLMEPVRTHIEAYVLDWITRSPLKRSWFFEQRDGTCRLMADLTVQLSQTTRTWSHAVAPHVEWFAQALSANASDTARVKAPGTRLTQRKRYEGQGSEVPQLEPSHRQHSCCVDCGAVTNPGTRRCPDCVPEEAGRRLAAASAKGRIAANTPEAQALKSAKMLAHREAIANWNPAELPEWLDEQFFLTKIQPALSRVRKQVIADALGINITVAYKYANGTRIPHKRHWMRLAELVGVTGSVEDNL